MGNRLASRHQTNKDFVVQDNILEDQLDEAADQYYGNTLAVIKLRNKKRLTNIPNGVFRCILEYQLPRVFVLRYSEEYNFPAH